jgi:hypothetical protein
MATVTDLEFAAHELLDAYAPGFTLADEDERSVTATVVNGAGVTFQVTMQMMDVQHTPNAFYPQLRLRDADDVPGTGFANPA